MILYDFIVVMPPKIKGKKRERREYINQIKAP
jgi:hypothetical protein